MKERIHGGNIQEFCEQYGYAPDRVLDFSTNVNFMGAPPAAVAAIGRNLDLITNYPDCRQKALKEGLSDYLRMPAENILVGNGSAEIIFLLCQYYRPEQALILAPTFGEYELAIEAVHGSTIFLNLDANNNFALPIDKAMRILPEVDMAFVCNPNNPTGTLFRPEELLELVRAAQTLIIDEAFIDFADSRNSLRQQVLAAKNLIVVGSLTKFFAIPGLRLGYALADSQTIRQLNALRDPWSINCFAEIAGREVVKDQEYISLSKTANLENRNYLSQKMYSTGAFKVFPSEANFILVEICDPNINSISLQKDLAEYGILIRECSSFRNLDDRSIRLAVRSKEDADHLVSCIERILEPIAIAGDHNSF